MGVYQAAGPRCAGLIMLIQLRVTQVTLAGDATVGNGYPAVVISRYHRPRAPLRFSYRFTLHLKYST